MGLTSEREVQQSIDQLDASRRDIMANLHGFAAPLLGDNERIDAPSEVGDYASAGSGAAGSWGRAQFGAGLTLLAGIAYGEQGKASSRLSDAILIAAALRGTASLSERMRLFGQLGGVWSPSGDYRFTRTYANGAGTATGTGRSTGEQSYVFARAGLAFELPNADELALSAEYGRQRLKTKGYAETLSATNPFEAQFGKTRERFDIVKARVQYSHAFSDKLDMTATATLARSVNDQSSLAPIVAGFGIVTPVQNNYTWGEFGLRVGWKLSDRLRLDAFTNAVVGPQEISDQAHFGAALKLLF